LFRFRTHKLALMLCFVVLSYSTSMNFFSALQGHFPKLERLVFDSFIEFESANI